MSISGSQVKIKTDAVIDPNFFLPPGVIDMRYSTEQDVSSEDDYTSDEEVDVTVVEVGVTDNSQADTLTPPDNITIISQTVKISPDGHEVVDVVLEVDDIPGVTSYEVRLAKP